MYFLVFSKALFVSIAANYIICIELYFKGNLNVNTELNIYGLFLLFCRYEFTILKLKQRGVFDVVDFAEKANS